MNIPETLYRELDRLIASEDIPVGIDAKKLTSEIGCRVIRRLPTPRKDDL